MLFKVYKNEIIEEIELDLDNINFVKLNQFNDKFVISIQEYKGEEFVLALDKYDNTYVINKYKAIVERINLITNDYLKVNKFLSVNMHNIVDMELEKNNKLLKKYYLKIYFYDGKMIESTKTKFPFKFNSKIYEFKARQKLLDDNFLF